MTTWRALAALAALSLIGMPSYATAAQLQCGPTTDVLKAAKDIYGEVPTFAGVGVGGGAVTITISPKGSWTMFAVAGPNLCALAVGEAIKPEAAAPDAKPDAKAIEPGLQANGLILIRQ